MPVIIMVHLVGGSRSRRIPGDTRTQHFGGKKDRKKSWLMSACYLLLSPPCFCLLACLSPPLGASSFSSCLLYTENNRLPPFQEPATAARRAALSDDLAVSVLLWVFLLPANILYSPPSVFNRCSHQPLWLLCG